MVEFNHEKTQEECEGQKKGPEYFLYLMTPVQGRIFAYILSRWPNKSDAEDIMQETISILWKKFDTYEPGTEFHSWAFAVVKFVLMNYSKKNKNNHIQFSEQTLEVLEEQSEKHLKSYNSQIDILRTCIGKLPAKEMKIIKLKYEVGLSTHKIANTFGISSRTFYRVLSKIHNSLIKCMNLSSLEEQL